jgi:ribosomal-protein-alanine N-acetyltransferase
MAVVTIEPAHALDLSQILELEEQCFSHPHTGEQLLHELDDDAYDLLVAKDGETVLGYAGLSHVLDEGFISNVAVAEQARRKGVADALLKALDALSEKYTLSFISLEVREGNEPAIRLYEKNGYRKMGEIPNYYSLPKENALVMTKTYHRERNLS